MMSINLAIPQCLESKFRRPLDSYATLSQNQILSATRKNYLFGVVECDIRVPSHLNQKFSEMPPIFKNTDICREDIGPYMQAFAEEHNLMPRPRRS